MIEEINVSIDDFTDLTMDELAELGCTPIIEALQTDPDDSADKIVRTFASCI
ncbi:MULTISPECIES: hypothetical protein [Actinomadura]|uniref:hypothetical protein n=1 Tax=Actinomadura TaxID=1988 RepID=UPI0003AD1AD2|nr:hypothetical protein [Actinomadura madurae]